jgi:uncharacterized membrane protein
MRASLTQPALFGGLVMGVLSALPIISAGNLCCCLWVISGGVVAAYLLQQNQTPSITPADGALVGLLAGVAGAFVYLFLSIPITFLIAPVQRQIMARIVENAGGMPPQFREFMRSRLRTGVSIILGFALMLVVGVIFSTLGGLVGAVVFRKPSSSPPPPSSAPAEAPPSA